ncbi:MAG TPA: DUF5667 domain-containing protein [Anaerolineales bacterium]|nr:DUF5667 domain-containing protein [Anaerolineales bacterium]
MIDLLMDALEICLQKVEQGETVESVLSLFPDLESELRPVLQAALQARTLADQSVPAAAQRRGRARLLSGAAELRESQRGLSKRTVSFFPRMVLALSLTAVVVLSSTGLVGASSNSLPGDQLYPVKRTWERVQLAFVLNQQRQDALQSQFEQERLNEIDELLTTSRAQQVTFSGVVSKETDGRWLISGIPVLVTNTTHLLSAEISSSMPVTVTGTTGSNGVLEADEIESLQPGSMLPPLEPSHHAGATGQSQETTTTVAGTLPTQFPAMVQTPAATPKTPQSFTYTGVVQGEQGTNWTINGQSVSVDQVEVGGTIQVGQVVRFGGYYAGNGNFIITSIESDSQGSPSHANGGDNSNNGHNNNGGGDDKGGGHGRDDGGGGD